MLERELASLDIPDAHYETPSQFVQGTMFKFDRMKRHLRALREIRDEYPSESHGMTGAIDRVFDLMDRNVVEILKAGLRDLGEI